MKLTEKQMAKLREHAKLHQGGMRSRHMRNMVKFMKEGDSFALAHKKAMKIDNVDNKVRKVKRGGASGGSSGGGGGGGY